jgi:hypothetical protein
MLNVSAIDGNVPQILRSLISDFRRTDTSSAEIIVQPRLGSSFILDFYDARFPPNVSTGENSRRVATLRYEAGNLVLRSSRIKNNKFNHNATGFYERTTKEPRNMLKLMRQFISPLTMAEIIGMHEDVTYSYRTWVNDPDDHVRQMLAGTGSDIRDDLIEEMAHLKALGIEMKTDQFRKIADEALPLHEEYQRRTKLKAQHMHIYVEPSGKVVVTSTKDTVRSSYIAESVTYPSMEEVPENIRQQVYILKMVEKNTYVPEVGQCMADGIYWVHVFPTS